MRLLALLAVSLFAGTLFLGCGPAAGPTSGLTLVDNAKVEEQRAKDEKAIVGTWKVTRFDGHRKDDPFAAAVFAEKRYTYTAGGRLKVTDKGTESGERDFKLNPGGEMKAIDLTSPDGTTLGLYELEGDTLRLCLGALGGKDRPSKFESDGKDVHVFTLKRVTDETKDEAIDNPEFKSWSKFKPGTSIVMKATFDFGDVPTKDTVTTKLIEVKDDKVVVERTTEVNSDGTVRKGPAEKQDVPKQKQPNKTVVGFDQKTGLPEDITEEGKEKVKVGGTEYECKWYKFKIKAKSPSGEEEAEGQLWVSDDVPGERVKMKMKWKTGGSSFEVTEVTIKK